MPRSQLQFSVASPRRIGSKALAKRVLTEVRTDVIHPGRAAGMLEAALGRHASSVIKCVFNVSEIDGFRYTVVDIWTRGDPRARDRIFSLREDFVRLTGWYPRSHGEPLSRPPRMARPTRVLPALEGLGSELVAIERVAASDPDGRSTRIRTDRGSILLDAGKRPELKLADHDVLVLLTHAHEDHSGGVRAALANRVPVLMSATTRALLPSGHIPSSELARIILVPARGGWHSIGDRIRIRAFTVPHMPGSVGFQLTDGVRSILYTGDICLHTRRHNFVDDLVELTTAAPRSPAVVVLDGEMFGREHGATRDAAAAMLFEAAREFEEVVVVANYPEQALYCYLDLFHTRANSPALRHEWAFICTPGVRRMMELLLRPITWKNGELDPFLSQQYRSNAVWDLWGESTFLYWSDTMTSLPTLKRIWITSEAEASKVTPSSRPVQLVRIGRREPLVAAWSADAVTLDLPTSPWTAHSDQESLLAAADRLAAVAEVVLFHTSSKRVNSYAREHESRIRGLSKQPIPLSAVPRS